MGWQQGAFTVVIIEASEPGQGLFMYDGAPAAGNLVASLTPFAGSDTYGNSYPAGFALFDSSGNVRILLATGATPYLQLENAFGAVIGLMSSRQDALLWYTDTGGTGQGDLVAGIAGKSGTDVYGNFYFQGLTVYQGEISGSTISGSVMLAYDGTPGAGNLIASIAGAAGTDSHGNGYLAGVGTYDSSSDFINLDTGAIAIGNSAAGGTSGTIQYNTFNLEITSPSPSGGDAITLKLASGTTVPNIHSVLNGPLYTTASPGVGTAKDDWNYAAEGGNPDFGSGWSNRGGSWAKFAWRNLASPPNCVQLLGNITASSTDPQLITLPSGYAPASEQSITGTDSTATSAAQWNILPSGLVTLDTSAVNGDNYSINGVFSLDI